MTAALKFEEVCIEICETYPKQTYRNRCKIATSSGVLNLTVPVNRIYGNHTKTNEIRIDYAQNWQLLHWKSIVTAYSKSPYFLYYRDCFEPIFGLNSETLLELNFRIFTATLKALNAKGLRTICTEEYMDGQDFLDLRNEFHPKEKTNKFLCFELPRYIQTFEENHGFIPDLSILDLIFNLGPLALPYLTKVGSGIQIS